jgi:hypothetical protein
MSNGAKASSLLRGTKTAWPDEAETAMVASIVAYEKDELQQAYDFYGAHSS